MTTLVHRMTNSHTFNVLNYTPWNEWKEEDFKDFTVSFIPLQRRQLWLFFCYL